MIMSTNDAHYFSVTLLWAGRVVLLHGFCHHRIWQWLFAWWHQAIPRTNEEKSQEWYYNVVNVARCACNCFQWCNHVYVRQRQTLQQMLCMPCIVCQLILTYGTKLLNHKYICCIVHDMLTHCGLVTLGYGIDLSTLARHGPVASWHQAFA